MPCRRALALSLLLASVAAPCLADDAPAADLALGDKASYSAPTGALTSLSGLKSFVTKAVDSPWDVDRAARVEKLKYSKDEGQWELTGWMFLRKPVDGITYTAQFIGEGTFKLTPPIKMEKDQVIRFLGSPTVDKPIKTARFTFTGADDQQFFEGLTYTAEAAKACEAENEECAKYIKGVREFLEKGETSEAAARRRFSGFTTAAAAYERFLNPRFEGMLESNMTVKVPEGQDPGRSHLVGLGFEYQPEQFEEVTVTGTFSHGKYRPTSLITQFHAKGQYDATSDRTASSAFTETETKDDIGVRKNRLRMVFDPGGRRDMKMKAEMDVVVLAEDIRYLVFYITGLMGTTKAVVDGKEMDFYQPLIPGQEWQHSPFILVSVPRVYKKGEEIKVALDVEGSVLYNVNGTTWMVKEEDIWFPTPSFNLGGDIAPRFDTTLITPKGFTAIANGREMPCEEGEGEPGMQCTRFATNTGIDFATFNIGRDLRVDKGESMQEDADRDGKPDPVVPIRVYTNSTAKNEFVWVDPDNPALLQKRSYSLSENGPDAVGRAQIARKVYTEWFGPCPYDTLMITPHPKGHGRGSASLLLVWQDAFLSSTANAEWASLTKRPYTPYDMTAFLVHEIAHQWWGGAVRIRNSRDQWFSEGFSDYASALVLEELDRVQDTRWFWGKLSELRKHLMEKEGLAHDIAPLCLGNRFVSAENPEPFNRAIARQNFMYSKGAYVMHMLRMLARAKEGDPEKGDELFKKVMHDFVTWCVETGRAPSNVDMERSFEKSFGMQLDFFFDQWIYGMGMPKVDWSYEVVSNPDGTYTVKGRTRQKDTSFQFPLAVSFYDEGKEVGFSYTWIGKKESEFSLGPLPFKPEKIAVNTEEGVLGTFKEVPAASMAAAAGQ